GFRGGSCELGGSGTTGGTSVLKSCFHRSSCCADAPALMRTTPSTSSASFGRPMVRSPRRSNGAMVTKICGRGNAAQYLHAPDGRHKPERPLCEIARIRLAAALIPPSRAINLRRCPRGVLEEWGMRMFVKWMMAATVGASALACVGVGAAAAADVPVPYSQPREYYPPPQQGYVYREAPPVYPAPPPVYRYYEAP